MTAWRKLRLSTAAADDIAEILDYSAEQFGPAARQRYEALIAAGLQDLRSNALRPATIDRPELGVRTYHLRHARMRADSTEGAVGAPRHILVYELTADEMIRVMRVLHDAMELERHLHTGNEMPGDS